MYLTEHILQKKDWHKKRGLLDVSWIHKIRGTFVALKLRSVPSSVNDFRVKWRLWAISQHFELFLASGWIMYARKEIIAFSFAILSCPSLFSRWLKTQSICSLGFWILSHFIIEINVFFCFTLAKLEEVKRFSILYLMARTNFLFYYKVNEISKSSKPFYRVGSSVGIPTSSQFQIDRRISCSPGTSCDEF